MKHEQRGRIPGVLADSRPLVIDNSKPKEVVVPAKQETFEAQVLVFTRPYTRLDYPFGIDGSTMIPFSQIQRVLQLGRYRLDFVPSSLLGGKPTLIIHERDEDDEQKRGREE